MSAVKKYFKEEVQWRNVDVQHSNPADFHLSVWQTNRSSVPLLVLRALLFLTALSITITSMVLYILKGSFGFWFIYLTHWGLIVLTLACGFSTCVSARCYFYGPISNHFWLPWYVKAYWVLYNIAVPIAFLITLFYWTVLYQAGVQEELDPVLDVAVHGINSLLMFLLLVTASHPSRLLHIYQPLLFGLTYFMFGLVYYLAGGTDAKGNPWIYAVLDWNNAGTTFGVGVLTGVLLLFLYLHVIGIALARDAISRKYVKPPNEPVESRPSETVPLNQPAQNTV